MEATAAVMWLTLLTTVATPTSDNVTEAGIDYNVSSWSPIPQFTGLNSKNISG